MTEKLKVRISEESGLPYACVPACAIWDLVEYLAAQRASVHYAYAPEGFIVSFHRLEASAAQQLLDEWAGSQISDRSNQKAGTSLSQDMHYIPG